MDSVWIIVGGVLFVLFGGYLWSRRKRALPAPQKTPAIDASTGREATAEIDVAKDDAVVGERPITAPPEGEAPPPAPEETIPSIRPDEAGVKALRTGLASTRGNLFSRLAGLFAKTKIELDPALLEQVEEVLITADVGVKTADRFLNRLREGFEGKTVEPEEVWDEIRAEAQDILEGSGRDLETDEAPTVILVVGVNGVGKTTTIGKLASRLRAEGKRVLLAAGDTFRAAAVTQLEVWGRRTECEVVKGEDRADPSSVVFDAIKRGVDEQFDVVICDTAGRLHTKAPLMEELRKVGRTAEKALGRTPDHIMLVLDATTGQNAIQQTALFKEALPVNAIALTKLDGTAKGGVILGIVDEHQIPVRYIGIGERVEDLRPFHAASFVDALFYNEETTDDEEPG